MVTATVHQCIDEERMRHLELLGVPIQTIYLYTLIIAGSLTLLFLFRRCICRAVRRHSAS